MTVQIILGPSLHKGKGISYYLVALRIPVQPGGPIRSSLRYGSRPRLLVHVYMLFKV